MNLIVRDTKRYYAECSRGLVEDSRYSMFVLMSMKISYLDPYCVKFCSCINRCNIKNISIGINLKFGNYGTRSKC